MSTNIKVFLIFRTLILIVIISSSHELFSQESTINAHSGDLNEVTFEKVERVPVYPGCDSNMGNQALKECFNEQMRKHVSQHFNSNIGKDLGLPDGSLQKINVFFKIDKNGKVSDVKVRSSNPKFEAEALRIIDLLPTFEPGYIDGEAVRVPYFLPIKFEVSNAKTPLNQTFPIYRGCDESLDYQAQKKCTTDKITDYIKVSVNYELADKLFPLDKSTQFQVKFTINKKGKLENISAQANKREMAAEAINVLKRMPKLKNPGFKNGEPTITDMQILMTIYF